MFVAHTHAQRSNAKSRRASRLSAVHISFGATVDVQTHHQRRIEIDILAEKIGKTHRWQQAEIVEILIRWNLVAPHYALVVRHHTHRQPIFHSVLIFGKQMTCVAIVACVARAMPHGGFEKHVAPTNPHLVMQRIGLGARNGSSGNCPQKQQRKKYKMANFNHSVQK